MELIDEINERIYQVREFLIVAYTGQKSDSSWIKPLIANDGERRIYLQSAICEVDRIMETLKKYKIKKNE